jgi:hypothetical protein
MPLHRREILRILSVAGLAHTLLRRDALAAPAARDARDFLQALDAAGRRLASAELAEAAWQSHVEALARGVDVAALRRAIDFDTLATRLEAHHDAAGGGDSLRVPGLPLRCATRVFCLRKGEAITPHGHRNMASMHLVLDGELRVRHFARVRDDRPAPPPRDGLSPAGGFLILRPTVDRISTPGDATSISSVRDNVHWFVARSERAFTFDCILTGLHPAGYEFGIDLVDPDRAERLRDGSLRAPVIGWSESIARYGRA